MCQKHNKPCIYQQGVLNFSEWNKVSNSPTPEMSEFQSKHWRAKPVFFLVSISLNWLFSQSNSAAWPDVWLVSHTSNTSYIISWKESFWTSYLSHITLALQRVINTAKNIIGTYLPSISDISEVRCLRRAQRILKDNTHPSHSPFTMLPSGKRYRTIRCHITRLQSNFFPQAVELLNSSSALHQKLFFALFFCW